MSRVLARASILRGGFWRDLQGDVVFALKVVEKAAQRSVLEQAFQARRRVEDGIGPNGKALDADGRELLFVIEQYLFNGADQASGPNVLGVGALGQQGEGFVGKFDLNVISAEVALFGQDDAAFGIAKDFEQIFGAEVVQHGDDGQTPDELGFKSVFDQILGPAPGIGVDRR